MPAFSKVILPVELRVPLFAMTTVPPPALDEKAPKFMSWTLLTMMAPGSSGSESVGPCA